jgi:hypothetical protein
VKRRIERATEGIRLLDHGVQHLPDFFEAGVHLGGIGGREITAIQRFAGPVLRFQLLRIRVGELAEEMLFVTA